MEENKVLFYDQFLNNRGSKMFESNYPPGSSDDPRAPWNDKGQETERKGRGEKPASIEFRLLSTDGEFAIFADARDSDELYISYIEDSVSIGLEEYRGYTKKSLGRDEDGDQDYELEYSEEFENDEIENWAYDTIKISDIGEGFEDWESTDFLMVKIDAELAQELYNDFSKYSSKDWRSEQKHSNRMPDKKTLLAYNDMKDDIKKVFPSVVSEW